MVTVLYGKMGTGKSTYILDRIMTDCGKKTRSFLIVPEQRTVIAEREIATSMKPSSQLYTEATNFSRLANTVFRTCGGLSYNYITKSGKSLCMYRALCEVRDSLKQYKILKGREKNAVATFLDAVGELKTYGISSEEIIEASEKVEDKKLALRLKDLDLIRSVYEKIMYEKYADPYDDILLLAKKLKENRFFEGAHVYIDSFYGFTKSQLNVIEEIGEQAAELVIALDMPKDADRSAYARVGATATQIEKMCARRGFTLKKESFDTDYLHKNKAIAYISDNLWDFGAPSLKEHCGITLVTPEDEFDECEYVASRIKKLVIEGARYSDIAVIMGKSDTYNGIIDLTLDKYGIPSFFSKKTDISSKPVIKMVFSALSILDGYETQSISDFIKCGYADIDEESGAELVSYMYRWGIRGKKKFLDDDYWGANPDGYVLKTTESQAEELLSVNETRSKIIEYLSPLMDAFEKKLTCKEVLLRIYDLLESFKVREKLDEEIKTAEKEEAIETAQVYNGFIKALDIVNDIMGADILSPEAFINVLRYALEGVRVGSIPTGEDKVTVGDASSLRTKSVDHVFILGATAGKFPADIGDDGFFSDRDKIELETVGVNLSSLSDERCADEMLNFKNAIAIASQGVCILAPKGTLGGKSQTEPSIGFLRVKELLSGIEPIDTAALPLYEKIYTENVAREYISYGVNPTTAAIKNILNEDISPCDFSNEAIEIGEEKASEIFGSSVSISHSTIETYVYCHFKYYCDYLLSLRDDSKISFNSRDVGNISHAVFERFLKRVKEENINLSALIEDEIKRIVDEIIEDYVNAICGAGRRSNRLKRLFDRLKDKLYIFIGSIIKEFSVSKFEPKYFELPISDRKNGVPPLKFKIGESSTLTLNGACDRVDIFKRDGDTYIRVVDYKSGSKSYSKADASLGLSLQLMIYLFSICKMGDCNIRHELGNGKLLPAGMLYFPLDIDSAKREVEAGFGSEEAISLEKGAVEGGIKRTGVFLDNIEILTAQDKDLKGEYIPAYPSKLKTEEVFVSSERFEELYKEMKETIEGIGKEMLSGNAKAIPLERKYKTSPCEYCANRAVCRRRK